MKQIVCIITAATALGLLHSHSTAYAQSMSLDVKPVSSGGAAKIDNSPGLSPGPPIPMTQSFSSNRQRRSGVGLAAEIRNLGRESGEAKLEWYFFGKSVNGGESFIYEEGSESVVVAPGGRKNREIQSSELVSLVQKSLRIRPGYYDSNSGQNVPDASSAAVRKYGSKVAGWIVRLVAGNKVIQVRASTHSLETLGRNDSALHAVARQLTRKRIE